MNNGSLLILVLPVIVVAEIFIFVRPRNSWTSGSITIVGLTVTVFLGVIFGLSIHENTKTEVIAAVFGLLGGALGFLGGSQIDSKRTGNSSSQNSDRTQN